MYPPTGFTPELTNEQKARNIINRLCSVIGKDDGRGITMRLLADEGAITPEFVRKLDDLTRQAEQKVAELERVHELIIEAEVNDLRILQSMDKYAEHVHEFVENYTWNNARKVETGDLHYPAVAETADMPRADDQQRLADEAAMREESTMDNIADSRREYRFGKSL